MALAKDPQSIQSSCSLYGNFLGSETSSSSSLRHQISDPLVYRFDHDRHRERDTANTFVKHLQTINPKGSVFDSTNFDHQHEQAYDGSSKFLSFVQNESSPDQESYTKSNNDDRDHDEYSSLWENFNSTYGAMMGNGSSSVREKVQHGDRDMFGLFFNEENDNVETGTAHVNGNNKRHLDMGESMQTLKKQCSGINNTSKKAKLKTVSTKDPQSIAAKNRRERISERLKVLQELVPNGCKVDLVTMLEKAISYVKFLQLQVKVLATDEFWPTQGGQAPEISQVKEAIDVILSSQRDKN